MVDKTGTVEEPRAELSTPRQRLSELERLEQERDSTEEKLREQRDRAQKYLDVAAVMLLAIGADQEVTLINRRGLDLLDYKQEEVVGKDWFDTFLPERVKDEVKTIFAKLMAGEAELVEHYENPVLTRSGEEKIIAWHNTVLSDENGKITGTLSSGEDITERKRAENALSKMTALNESIVQCMGEGILIVDAQGRITFTNPTADALLGYEAEELIGQEWVLIVPPDQRPVVEAADERRARGELDRYELELVRKDGSRVPVQVSGSPRLKEGRFTGSLAVFTDISEQKRVEEALVQRTYELGERVKELRCLYGISKLVEEPGISLEELFQGAVDLLPAAWQYPEIACARLSLKDREFRTDNYREGSWRQSSDISVYGDYFGSLEVCYLEERPESDEGPFLKEERLLLDVIAGRLGRVIEHHRAKEELRDSEERLKAMFEFAPDAYFLSDLRGNIMDANRAAQELLDYEKEDLIGKSFLQPELLPADQLPKAAASVARSALGRAAGPDEIRLKRKDESQVTVEMRTFPLMMKGQSLVLGIARDITERKRAEDALRQSEERHRGLFENSPIALWEQDCHEVKEYVENLRASGIRDFVEFFENHPETVRECARLARVTDVNQAALDLYQADSKGELLGNLDQVFTEESYDVFRKELLAISGGRTTFHAETSARTLNGERKDIALRWAVMPGCEATYSRVLVSDTDITERKSAEEALRESEERYRDLFESANDLIQSVGPDGRFQYVNRAWRETLGYSEAEIDKLSVFEIVHPNSLEHCQDVFQRVMSGEMVGSVEAEFLSKAGETIAVEGHVSCSFKVGKPVATRAIFRDVTSRKRAETEIARNQRLLLALSQAAAAVQQARAPEEVFQAIGDEVVKLGHNVAMLTLTDDGQHLSIPYMTLPSGLLQIAEKLVGMSQHDYRFRLVPGGFFDQIITYGETTFTRSFGESLAGELPQVLRRLGSRAVAVVGAEQCIGAPLTVGGERLGVLAVSGEGLTEADVPAITAFANQAAIALQNARLYQRIVRNLQELSLLHEAAMAGASTVDFDEVLEGMVEAVSRTEPFQNIGIFLVDELSNMLWCRAARGSLEGLVGTLSLEIGQGIIGSVTQSGEPMLAPDVSQEARHYPGVHETRSEVCVPLMVGQRIMGALDAQSPSLDAFSESDLRLLFTVAGQLAMIIENTGLYQSVADKERELRHQIETAADAIFNLDVEGRFTLFNREAERLSGYQREDVLGQPYAELVCPEYLEEVGEMLSPNATPEVLQQVHEIEIFDKWGDRIPLEIRASILETDGQLVGWQVIGRDISERKHLEEMKSQFIATVSHDLRTPLASIMGFAETLMEGSPGPLTEIQEEFLGIIFENSQRQLALVNDLLDVSKLEAGRLQLEMEEVHLPELIWGAVEQIRPLAEKKRIALTMKVNKELPRTEGDPRRLERVFNNLLSNAVKFTPEGGSVEVAAWQDDGHLKVSVSDTGVGIPAEDLPDLFQPFHRGRNVTKQAIEGTGLGLTIVKALVEAHRGTIEVESELEKGTTFELTLPLREPATK